MPGDSAVVIGDVTTAVSGDKVLKLDVINQAALTCNIHTEDPT